MEPWNGRRKSHRVDSNNLRKRDSSAVPPLPGQESNVRGLPSVTEGVATSASEVATESSERGRLFVKVVGVKDLDLPLPRSMLQCRLSLVSITNVKQMRSRGSISL